MCDEYEHINKNILLSQLANVKLSYINQVSALCMRNYVTFQVTWGMKGVTHGEREMTEYLSHKKDTEVIHL